LLPKPAGLSKPRPLRLGRYHLVLSRALRVAPRELPAAASWR